MGTKEPRLNDKGFNWLINLRRYLEATLRRVIREETKVEQQQVAA
ncbi:MAG: hypothetical protein WBL07_12595 [Thiothrix litoralis]|nr:hypothetical protein [Thiothrix litoralis]